VDGLSNIAGIGLRRLGDSHPAGMGYQHQATFKLIGPVISIEPINPAFPGNRISGDQG
jgi:hypothetical protein